MRTRAMAGASAGVARRIAISLTSRTAHRAPHGIGDRLGREAEMLEEHAGRRRLAEAVDTDHPGMRIVASTDVRVPARRGARLDGDPRDAARQDVGPIGGILSIECLR